MRLSSKASREDIVLSRMNTEIHCVFKADQDLFDAARGSLGMPRRSRDARAENQPHMDKVKKESTAGTGIFDTYRLPDEHACYM